MSSNTLLTSTLTESVVSSLSDDDLSELDSVSGDLADKNPDFDTADDIHFNTGEIYGDKIHLDEDMKLCNQLDLLDIRIQSRAKISERKRCIVNK